MQAFGSLLRSHRKAAGLTQRDLAAAVGLDHTYISKVESGSCLPPSAPSLIRIAVTLGLDEDTEADLYAVAELTKAPKRITNAALLRNPGLRPFFEWAAQRRLTPKQLEYINRVAQGEEAV